MKVYIDLLLITNFIFDFIVLLSTSIILKRSIKLTRILFGSIIGSLSILTLFIRFNSITLFFYKIIVSFLMIVVTFKFNNSKYFFKNIYYFYMISIIIGGIIYFFKNQFSKNNGLVFFNNYSGNIIFGIIISIIGIIIYLKNIKDLKTNYNKYIKCKLYINNEIIDVYAFLDTGNKLKDPFTFKPIILVDRSIIKEIINPILVPFKTLNNDGLLTCIKPRKIYIEGIGYKKNFLVGLSDSFRIDGINCILNERLLEE